MSKVKLDREIIISKLQKAVKYVPSKTMIPAFDNFRLSVQGNVMNIIASDGNIQVTLNCPVSSKDAFTVCLPAKLLLKTLMLFRENDVTITMKSDTKVEVKSGKSKYNISVECQPNDFPIMRNEAIDNEMAIGQFFLQKALKMTEKFVDDKNTVSNLIGIKIEQIKDRMVFTGADGAIMCRYAAKPLSINKWAQIVIPTETASKVASLLSDKGEIGISSSSEKITFFTDSADEDAFQVCSVLAKVKFPNTEGLFDKCPTNSIVLNTLEVKDAIKRLSLYSSGDSPSFIIQNTNDKMSINLSSNDNLQNRDGEEVITLMDELVHPIVKSFGSDYFIQILNNVDTNEFEFFFNENEKQPCFIIPCVNSEEEKLASFLIVGRMINV